MSELHQLFNQRRAQFERDVAAMPDHKGAHDICVRYLGDVKRDYLDGVNDPHLRLRLNELMVAAEAGMALMIAISQVDIKMGLPNRLETRSRRRLTWREILPYVPCSLCGLLGVWLYFEGETNAAVTAVIAGVVSLVTLLRLKPPVRSKQVPDVYGEPRVDPIELARRMEGLFTRVDEMLRAKSVGNEQDPLMLTGGLMESVQMLMEARLTNDGAYALKALPQMMAALERQGVEIEMYTDASRTNFDLMPAPMGGETIRPALIKDGRLILRGQATIKG